MMDRKFDDAVDASELAKSHYTEYSIYVNGTRALADCHDGLKFVQRRIINEASKLPDTLTKSTNIVGNAIKYHPHGSDSIYGALVGLASPISNLPLFDIQGNWGGYGFRAAADRYTECKISKLARFIYCQFSEYAEMVTGEIGLMEPKFLPCLLSYGLIAGQSGIGVGLSADVVPLNIMDLIDYQLDYIKNECFDYMKTPRPDFGAMIIDMSDDECRQSVQGYRGWFCVKSIIKQESDTVFVIESLYDKKIEAVLKKLGKYIDSDQVDFRNESKTRERYVFEVVDRSVDIDKFKKDLENATVKRSTFNRVFVNGDKSIYCSLNYVITHQMQGLNEAIDRKMKTERESLMKRSVLLRALRYFKQWTNVLDNLTSKSSDDVISEMMDYKRKCDNSNRYDKSQNDLLYFTEDVAHEILRRPISYLTRDHDNELDEIDKKIDEIDNHDRKQYLINLYTELKEMVKELYDSRPHSILASQVMSNPRVRLIDSDGSQKLFISGKGKGVRFDKAVFLIGSEGGLYRRSVSAMSATELDLDIDEHIVRIVSDQCRYIEIISNDGKGIAADTQNYRYDKKVVNLDDGQRITEAVGYGEDAPDYVKGLVRTKIAKPVWYSKG